MKNIAQSISFPLSSIIAPAIPASLMKEIQALLAQEAFLEEKKYHIDQSMTDSLKELVLSFGVESPLDDVVVTLDVKTLFFDIYCKSYKKPESPLGRRLAEKKEQELAEALEQEDFQLPQWAFDPIREALLNDEQWAKIETNPWVIVNNNRRHFLMNSKGINFFKKVVDTAAQEFE